MAEDQASFGVAYWHRLHQLPSVWICPKHGSLLLESRRRQTVEAWAALCLPTFVHLRPVLALARKNVELVRSWMRIAENSASYIENAPLLSLDRCRVCSVLAEKAVQLGAVDDAGKLDFHKCAHLLMQTRAPSYSAPAMGALGEGERRAASMARRMLESEFRLSVSDLMIAVSCMHGSWTAFLCAYQEQKASWDEGAESRTRQQAIRIFF